MGIHYAMEGPGVDVGWTLDDRHLDVDLLTGDTLSQVGPVRLGRFRTEASTALTTGLRDLVDRTRRGEEAPVGGRTVRRWIAVDAGPRHPVPVDDHAAALEAELLGAATGALSDPVEAVEVGAVGASLLVTALGVTPVPVVFFEDTDAGFWVRVYREDEGERTYVPFDTIRALAATGDLPSGEVRLVPGRSVALPLPAGTPPGAGGFWFWRCRGVARRPLSGRWRLSLETPARP